MGALSPQVLKGVGTSRRRERIRAAELRENDLTPICAHCAEYNDPGTVWCSECGHHLTEQRRPRHRTEAWSASA